MENNMTIEQMELAYEAQQAARIERVRELVRAEYPEYADGNIEKLFINSSFYKIRIDAFKYIEVNYVHSRAVMLDTLLGVRKRNGWTIIEESPIVSYSYAVHRVGAEKVCVERCDSVTGDAKDLRWHRWRKCYTDAKGEYFKDGKTKIYFA